MPGGGLVAAANSLSNAIIMIIACPACSTRYVVPDTAIGAEGRTVRCAKCRESWFQAPESTAPAAIVPAAPDARPAQTPPAQPTPPASQPAPPPAPSAQTPPAPPPRAPSAEAELAFPPAPREGTPASPIPDPEPPVAPPPSVAPASNTSAPEPTPPAAEPAATYADEASERYSDEARSSFEFEPPFRPRRNWVRLWTIGAVLFALIAIGAAIVVGRYGLPDWVPIARPMFAQAKPDLVLDFPPNRQDRRTLPNGTEFFGASGTITNVGQSRQSVPPILIMLRDDRDRVVYSWEVAPSKRSLAPGESLTINEAVTDVPKRASVAEIGWKPN